MTALRDGSRLTGVLHGFNGYSNPNPQPNFYVFYHPQKDQFQLRIGFLSRLDYVFWFSRQEINEFRTALEEAKRTGSGSTDRSEIIIRRDDEFRLIVRSSYQYGSVDISVSFFGDGEHWVQDLGVAETEITIASLSADAPEVSADIELAKAVDTDRDVVRKLKATSSIAAVAITILTVFDVYGIQQWTWVLVVAMFGMFAIFVYGVALETAITEPIERWNKTLLQNQHEAMESFVNSRYQEIVERNRPGRS